MTGDRIHVLQTGESDAQSPDVTEVLSAGGFEVTAAEAPASLAESTADCVVAVATDPESATDSPESTTDHPESTADHPESTADHPESTADHPESTTDHPESTTETAGTAALVARLQGDDSPPCIVVTADRSDPVVAEALTAGATDVCVWSDDADGRLLCARVRNAVEHDRSMRALRENRDRFDRAQELASVGSWERDVETRALTWSDETYRIFGYDPETFEVTYEAFFDAIHPDDRTEVREAIERALDGGETYDVEHRIVRPDGEERVVREHGEITFEGGEPSHVLGTVQDVTERAAREKQLERYRNIVENLPVGVWRTTPGDTGEFLEVNPEMVSLLGADSAEDLLDRDPRQFYKYAEDREEFTRQITDRGVVEQHEVRLETLDGGELWGSITAIATETPSDETYFDGMVVDVTERKELERKRERSERKFRAFAETSYDSFYRFDREGRYTYASPATRHVTGYEPEDLLGQQFSEVIHPDEHRTALEAFDRVIDGEGVEGLTLRLQRADGSRGHVSVNVVPIREDGEVVGAQGIARDVTERVERERELEHSRKKFRTLLEAAPDAILIADAETGELREVNRAAAEMFGRSEDELLGMTQDELHPDGERERYRRAFAEALERPQTTLETFDGDWVYAVDADGERTPVEINTKLVELDDQTLVHGIFRDITERKAREEKLRDYQTRLQETIDELERSNEELEQFAYIASHDLQEPLRMVSSYLDLLAAEYEGELDEEADEYIEFAVDGANRMRRLIDDLLKYSRVQTHGGEFETTSADEALDEALTNLSVAIDESDATVTRAPLPPVTADRNQLVQLFQNLVSNAIEYSGAEPPEIHVDAERRGDAVEISVADDGVGIDPDQQERIFEIFTRGDRRSGEDGTGVGLAICKRIVRRHGGDIEVSSTAGGGATFTFTIPLPEGER